MVHMYAIKFISRAINYLQQNINGLCYPNTKILANQELRNFHQKDLIEIPRNTTPGHPKKKKKKLVQNFTRSRVYAFSLIHSTVHRFP